ncbi:MAG: DUF4340 domain-containing protein [Burkholderiales bacterium]
MKSRTLLNLILVLALLALASYAYWRPRTPDTRPTIQLSQLKREDVDRITVERQGSPTITLSRQGKDWQLTAPLTTLADPYQVDRLADIAAMTASQKLVGTDFPQYGLDPAPIKVTLNSEAFSFGKINDITNEQYLGYGGGIYLVPPFYGYGIPAGANTLLSRKLLAEGEVPVAFEFGSHRIVRNESGVWALEGKVPARLATPPSQDDFNRWADEWRNTSALNAEPATRAAAKSQSLTLRFSGGKSTTLSVLPSANEFQVFRADRKIQYRFGREVGQRLLDPSVVAEKK